MLSLVALSLLSSPALAAPTSSNPGLERVCDSISEDATTAETLAAALDAVKALPPCDIAAESGICLGSGTKLLIQDGGGAAVVPVEPADPTDYDKPLYVYNAFDTNAGDSASTADIYVDGQLLVADWSADEPIQVEAWVYGSTTEGWVMVHSVSDGTKTTSLETKVDGTLLKLADPGTSIKGIVDGYDFDTSHELDSSFALASGGPYVTVTATISVTYENAGQ